MESEAPGQNFADRLPPEALSLMTWNTPWSLQLARILGDAVGLGQQVLVYSGPLATFSAISQFRHQCSPAGAEGDSGQMGVRLSMMSMDLLVNYFPKTCNLRVDLRGGVHLVLARVAGHEAVVLLQGQSGLSWWRDFASASVRVTPLNDEAVLTPGYCRAMANDADHIRPGDHQGWRARE